MAVTPSIAIRGVLARGCAQAASGAARRLAAKVPMNVRRSISASSVAESIKRHDWSGAKKVWAAKRLYAQIAEATSTLIRRSLS